MTSTNGDHLETEQKYDVDTGFVLPDLRGLGDLKAADPKRYYLSATYYDTDDLSLYKNRITLRRRIGGTDEGWHLKLPVRTNTRQEVHEPLAHGDTGTVPARLAAEVKDVTAGERLRPVALLDTEQTVVTLTTRAGEPVVEIADDRVTATRFGERQHEPLTWREIEAEVVSPDEKGAAGVLEQVGQALVQAGARPSDSPSKLSRVLQS